MYPNDYIHHNDELDYYAMKNIYTIYGIRYICKQNNVVWI